MPAAGAAQTPQGRPANGKGLEESAEKGGTRFSGTWAIILPSCGVQLGRIFKFYTVIDAWGSGIRTQRSGLVVYRSMIAEVNLNPKPLNPKP